MTGSDGLISARFRLGELLGTGGSASVFAAVDTESGASVALKLLHPHLSERAAVREAFFEEARRAEPLRHPNLAGVLGVGTHDADPPMAWIAFELAPGQSLAEHVERHGQLDVAESLAVLDGVLRALAAAHAIGLVHRDVSPANVMVAPDASGRITVDGVRLLDFGLADAAGRAALGTDVLRSEAAPGGGRAGVIGNVNSMSPEQVRGEAVDERGDLYQAGAVGYFALTGHPPFARATPAETMRAHLVAPPPVPSVLDSRIPRRVDRIVVRALLKDPADRFGSAAEMRAAVAEAAESVEADGGRRPAEASGGLAASRVATDLIRPRPDAPTRVLGSTRVEATAPSTQATVVQARPVRRAPGTAGAAGATGSGAGGRSRPPATRVRRPVAGWIVGLALAGAVATTLALAANAPAVDVPGSEPTPSAPVPQVVASAEPEPTATPGAEDEAPVPQVPVPDVVAGTLDEALRALADAGLEAGTYTVVDSERPGDTVLASTPSAGEPLRRGAAVALTIASGFNRVPSVTGLGRGEALAALQRAGFTVAIGSRQVAGVAGGAIVGTEPATDAQLALGTTVTLLEAETPPRATPTPTPTPTPSGPPPSRGPG
ncbi:PASTA domain-containing protein [Agromyces sp. MMS24-K17]|uniref:serine/threonine-protein kinase n=1 Tax=Agromyces sp. MMS24-K17 TaxID=3372850 RepID=UPI0037542E6A